MTQSGTLEPGPSHAEHGRRLVDAYCALRGGSQDLQHAPGSGADVEKAAVGSRPDGVAHGRFHHLFGDMHGPHLVPVRCVGGEVARGLPRSGTTNLLESNAVGVQDRVVDGECSDDIAREPRGGSRLRGEQEHPGAFSVAFHQAALDEQLEMT